MEYTQRLDCTQTVNYSDKLCTPEIGFLGICGKKYPLVKGPNKIGRDPICNIELNLNSISRQHAVIMILNNNDFKLMDLGSANKTKLLDKTLEPFISQPLKNGDMIQFGDVFGIFRVMDEDDDLPMTQIIPDTPVNTRFPSKINPVTTIPESPDFSDKEDSFIVPSQYKIQLKASKEQPSNKSISLKHLESNEIDNVVWNSSKKSISLNLSLNDSRNSLNDSFTNMRNKQNNDIHEMETQMPYYNPNKSPLPKSLYNVDTQMSSENKPQAIYNINTQIPVRSPIVHKNLKSCGIKSSVKNKCLDIYEVQTQMFPPLDDDNDITAENILNKEKLATDCDKNTTEQNNNASGEEILFEDVDSQSYEDNLESQCLLPKINLSAYNTENTGSSKDESDVDIQRNKLKRQTYPVDLKNSAINDVDLFTKEITQNPTSDGGDTDCEDILNENILITSKTETLANEIKTKVNPGHIKTKNINIQSNENEVPFEEMLTQKIMMESDKNNLQDDVDFQDLPTQIISEVIPNNTERIEQTQQFSEEIICSFKVPSKSKINNKMKFPSKIASISESETDLNVIESNSENYYQATQDIYQDLCSQEVVESGLFKKPLIFDSMFPSTKNCKVGKTFTLKEDQTSKNVTIEVNEHDDKVKKFLSSLSSQQIRDVIGVSSNAKSKRSTKDSSEESTPKKIKSSKLMDTDLPNSQEIKATVNTACKNLVSELSSDSESEINSEDQHTPILYHKKSKTYTMTDLTNKSNMAIFPTRIITRVRKPVKKYSNYLTVLDDDIDNEIISENLSRIKSKFKNSKSSRTANSKSIDNKTEIPLSKNSSNKTKTAQIKEEKSSTTTKSHDQKSKNSTTSRSLRSSKNKREKESSSKSRYDENKVDVKTLLSSNNDVKTESILNKRNTRSSRSKGSNVSRSFTPKLDDEKPVRKRSNRVQEKEIETRNSKRENIVKVKKESELVTSEINTNKTKNLSIVYSGSESNPNSPISLKRSAINNNRVPSPKRTRSSKLMNSSTNNNSLKSTPTGIGVHRVLLTSCYGDDIKLKLEHLGAVIENDIMKCTIMLTDNLKRTFKVLCAVGLGLPIVGSDWVQACTNKNAILDPWLYIIKDEKTEKRFSIDLKKILKDKRNFLKDYNVYSTPNVLPKPLEMKPIVECSGGKWEEGGSKWICVSTPLDKSLWPSLKNKGATIVSSEFILTGVLRQELDIDTHQFK